MIPGPPLPRTALAPQCHAGLGADHEAPGIEATLAGRGIETLERSLRTQAQIISDLLDVSRITSGKFEMDHSRVDLAAVAVASVESLRPMTDGKALTLALAVPDGPIYVDGDQARLQQVVTNVVHNAIKFTPERVCISLRVGEVEGKVEIEVSDNGQGIDKTLLPHIFDRFVQAETSTTRRHGDLGLGLAIVKELVERHGGAVRTESDGHGLGARFILAFPPSILRGREGLPQSLRASAAGSSLAALDVVVVDDDHDSREVLRISLEQAGARVRVACSTTEALAVCAASPPDVLVSDIGMPGEDGYALIRAIRKQERGTNRRVLAIATTGFASRLDREAALREGFDAHVAKPIELSALFERIRGRRSATQETDAVVRTASI